MWRLAAVVLSAVAVMHAAERIDNVLMQMVPPNSVSLFGAQMDQLKTTPLYQKLVAQQKLTQLDEFSAKTNFDPRRDVRELLVASTPGKNSGVLLARGNFRVKQDAINNAKDLRRTLYKGYTLWTDAARASGFCILDSTLAIAGPVASMHAALDQYQSRGRRDASLLLQKALAIPMRDQVWLVSTGAADFLADNVPEDGAAANFGRIFRGLEGTEVQADLSRGFNAQILGKCKTEADAKALADAAHGLVGFGRLSVPEGQSQLLRVWDAVQINQEGRNLSVAADIPSDLVEKLLQLFDPGTKRSSGRSSFYSSEEESHRPKSKSLPH